MKFCVSIYNWYFVYLYTIDIIDFCDNWFIRYMHLADAYKSKYNKRE